MCKAVLQSAANIDKMRKKTNLNAIETQMMVKAAQHCFQKIPFRALCILITSSLVFLYCLFDFSFFVQIECLMFF